jgi:HEAT repeat protein
MPRAAHLALLAAVGLGTAARGDTSTIDPVLAATPQVVAALTGVDFPVAQSEMASQKATLDALLGTTATDALSAIASAGYDTTVADTIGYGTRLRATRALALYPSDEARGELTALIAAHVAAMDSPASTTNNPGFETLGVIASVEALGQIGTAADVTTIVPLLDKEESRDVRSAAARALRDLGSATAIAPLHARLAKETVPQVQFWISDALRVLSGTPP